MNTFKMKKTIILALLLFSGFLLADKNDSNSHLLKTTNAVESNEFDILFSQFWSLDSDGMPAPSIANERFGHTTVHGDFNADQINDVAIGVPGHGGFNAGGVIIMYGTQSGLSAENSVLLQQSLNNNQLGAGFGYSLTAGDFNGDLITDLAVGTPFQDVNNSVDAGVFNVYYGSISGLSMMNFIEINAGTGQQFPDIEANAKLGWSMAAGNFDGDAYTDLAVSMPNKTIAVGAPPVLISDAGLVRVYHGTVSGITGSNFTDIFQGSSGVFGDPETGDLFGYSLAVGDFDRLPIGRNLNGQVNYDDLVIGVPFESFGATNNGVVQILMGSENGLVYSQLLSQSNTAETVEDNDLFGFTLTTGSIDGGFGDEDELIVGAPFEDINAIEDAGVVHVFYGSPSGLTTSGNQIFSQDTPGIFGTPEGGDNFGLAIAVGRFNTFGVFGDEYGDLAIGTPFESYLANNDGVVTIVYGGPLGLDTNGSTFLSNAVAHNDSNYGFSLLAVNFSNNISSFNSLIVGMPGQSSDGNLGAGVIEEIAFDGNDVIFKNNFD